MTSANLSALKSELGTTAYMHLNVVMAHMQSYHLNLAGEWLLRMFQDSGQRAQSDEPWPWWYHLSVCEASLVGQCLLCLPMQGYSLLESSQTLKPYQHGRGSFGHRSACAVTELPCAVTDPRVRSPNCHVRSC